LASRNPLADTHNLDIQLPQYKDDLLRLGTQSVLDLLELRRLRRSYMDGFFEAVLHEYPVRSPYANLLACPEDPCYGRPKTMIYGEYNVLKWRNLQLRVLREMEARPSSQVFKDRSFESWDEVKAFESPTITCPGCRAPIAGFSGLADVVRQVALSLPSSIPH